jgi:hypothetical protein
VVGAWPLGERHIRNQLPDTVLEIIEDKAEELGDIVGKVEGQLFRLTLTTSRGERVTPHNSYLDWLVVSLFRQWLADSTTPPPPSSRSPPSRGGTHHSRNNTNTTQHSQPLSPLPQPAAHTSTNQNLGRVFRTVGTSPGNFLLHDECKKFLKLSPEIYSRESLKKFEKRLDDMKAMAREIVKPLMRSSLLGEGSNTSFLTCSVIEDPRDFPWLNE